VLRPMLLFVCCCFFPSLLSRLAGRCSYLIGSSTSQSSNSLVMMQRGFTNQGALCAYKEHTCVETSGRFDLICLLLMFALYCSDCLSSAVFFENLFYLFSECVTVGLVVRPVVKRGREKNRWDITWYTYATL